MGKQTNIPTHFTYYHKMGIYSKLDVRGFFQFFYLKLTLDPLFSAALSFLEAKEETR